MAKKFVKVTGLHNVFNVYGNSLDTRTLKSSVETKANNNSILFIDSDSTDVNFGFEEGSHYIWSKGVLFNQRQIPFVNCSVETNNWSGDVDIDYLHPGQVIICRLAGNSNGNDVILTLNTRFETEIVNPVYFRKELPVQDQFVDYDIVPLIYLENVDIDNTSYTGWWVVNDSVTLNELNNVLTDFAQGLDEKIADIESQIASIDGTGNADIVSKESVDIKVVETVPVEELPVEYVIIRATTVGDADLLYKYEDEIWRQIEPDPSILYYDIDDERLLAYRPETFYDVTPLNTFIISGSISTNTTLKGLKTVGTYNVIQRTTSGGRNLLKNWTLIVQLADYEDDPTDTIYQKLTYNYTIYKRSYKQSTDRWSSWVKYYEGLVRDTKTSGGEVVEYTSPYYTWSSQKIRQAIDDAGGGGGQTYTAGDNIEINQSNEISALGYTYDENLDSFAEGRRNTITSGSRTHREGYATTTKYNCSLEYQTSTKEFLIEYEPINIDTVILYKSLLGVGRKIYTNETQYNIIGFYLVYNSYGRWARFYIKLENGPEADFNGYFKYDNSLGDYSHVEGFNNEAIGKASHAEGLGCTTNSDYSHAEGNLALASAESAHAEGQETIASGIGAHAEGQGSKASGRGSHAEGRENTASSSYTHAEGRENTASGEYTHAEGWRTVASGQASHAEGLGSNASGQASHAEGAHNQATNGYEHAEGSYNVSHTNTRHSVGIGTSNNDRKNAFEIMANGDAYLYGVGNYAGIGISDGVNNVKPIQVVISDLQTQIGNTDTALIAINNTLNNL